MIRDRKLPKQKITLGIRQFQTHSAKKTKLDSEKQVEATEKIYAKYVELSLDS